MDRQQVLEETGNNLNLGQFKEQPQFLSEEALFQKFANYTKRQINELIDDTILRWNYLDKFKIHMLIFSAFFVSLLILFLLYYLESKNQSQILLSYDQTCFNNTTICQINFQNYHQPGGFVIIYLVKQLAKATIPENRVILNQITGVDVSLKDAQGCFPYITNADMNLTVSKNGTALDPTAVANPCGTLSRAFPNIEIRLYDSNNNQVDMTYYKYNYQTNLVNYPPDDNSTQWLDIKDSSYLSWVSFNEDLIQYGYVNQQFPPGSYSMIITRDNQPYKSQPVKIKIVQYWTMGLITINELIALAAALVILLIASGYLIRYYTQNTKSAYGYVKEN